MQLYKRFLVLCLALAVILTAGSYLFYSLPPAARGQHSRVTDQENDNRAQPAYRESLPVLYLIKSLFFTYRKSRPEIGR